MIVRSKLMVFAVLVAVVGATACGDDDVTVFDGGRDSGGPRDGGGMDAPRVDSGPMDDAGGTDAPTVMDAPMTDSGPPPVDQCTNADDLAAFARSDYGPMMNQTVQQLSGPCGSMCVLGGARGDALVTCVSDCLVMATEDALSAECGACFGRATRCTAENCLAPPGNCLGDVMGRTCLECRCGRIGPMVNCFADFAMCTGLPAPACMALDDAGMPADSGTADGGSTTADGGLDGGGT